MVWHGLNSSSSGEGRMAGCCDMETKLRIPQNTGGFLTRKQWAFEEPCSMFFVRWLQLSWLRERVHCRRQKAKGRSAENHTQTHGKPMGHTSFYNIYVIHDLRHAKCRCWKWPGSGLRHGWNGRCATDTPNTAAARVVTLNHMSDIVQSNLCEAQCNVNLLCSRLCTTV